MVLFFSAIQLSRQLSIFWSTITSALSLFFNSWFCSVSAIQLSRQLSIFWSSIGSTIDSIIFQQIIQNLFFFKTCLIKGSAIINHVDLDLVRAFKRTRHCPACESGMSAPGIRRNAECKRSRASVGEEFDRVVEARRVTDATSADELVQGFSPVLTEDPHDGLVRDLSGAISGVSEGNSLGGLDDVFQLAFLATKSDDEVRELPVIDVC